MKSHKLGFIFARGVACASTCVLAAAFSGAAVADDRQAVDRVEEGHARPHAWIKVDASPKSVSSRSPSGFWPIDMQNAYGISSGGKITEGGHGATVAIVDAYDSPNALTDLNAFSNQFGLPAFPAASGSPCAPTFTKVNETGGATLPKRNAGWEVEINLDTQWVHAIAPCANIVLVEAASSNTNDLLAAVSYAKTVASVVSMSWGGNESRSQTSSDSTFLKAGVTFLASSGDSGAGVEWPSSSPNVIAVGGTQLAVAAGGGLAAGFTETGWNGSGGGCSTVEAALAFQKSFLPTSPVCRNRAVPDAAMSGGDASYVAVMISLQGGWGGVYGTSLSVQMFAGVIAIGNGIRGNALNGTLADLYADATGGPTSTEYLANYRDIAAYYSGERPGSFLMGKGWDFVTGLGAPLVNSLVFSYLAHQ
jgi:subtilase family serine protease